jgi:hypothetical protein
VRESTAYRPRRVGGEASEKNRKRVASDIWFCVGSCWWKAEGPGNRSERDTHHAHYRERWLKDRFYKANLSHGEYHSS